MTIVLILGSLALLCLGIFAWLWLCAGFRRGGWRGVAGIGALQISGLFLVYGILRGQPMAGLFMASFPPVGLVFVQEIWHFPALLRVLAGVVALWAAAVLLLSLAVRVVRVWAPGLALLTALVGAVVLGDHAIETAMCRAASERGIAAFTRMHFADSLTMGREHFIGPHALANVGMVRMGWSYRQMDWYVLPADVGGAVPETSVTCAR